MSQQPPSYSQPSSISLRCRYCNAENRPKASFCKNCGKKLMSVSQPQGNQQVQQQSISPQSPMSQKPPDRRPSKKLKAIGGFGVGAIVAISAIAAILQFMGFAHIQDLFIHPTPTPKPAPIIAESTYTTRSPYCDRSTDPTDIAWGGIYVTYACMSNDGGTQLTQTDLRYVPALSFGAAKGYQLAPNHTISADLSDIAPNVCAGIDTREHSHSAGGYAFYICGNGDGYILEYSNLGGTPIVLNSGKFATASDNYSLVITVNNSHLQMTVGGQTLTTDNSDYTSTDSASIVMSEEAVLPTYQQGHSLISIIVSNFHYEQS